MSKKSGENQIKDSFAYKTFESQENAQIKIQTETRKKANRIAGFAFFVVKQPEYDRIKSVCGRQMSALEGTNDIKNKPQKEKYI